MGLVCGCFEYEGDAGPGSVIWGEAGEYLPLVSKRAKRCCSCKEKIGQKEICVRVKRYKVPKTFVEVNIYGEDGEVPLADKHLCEKCADIMFSLEELGFCPHPWENQKELLNEYKALYGLPDGRGEKNGGKDLV